LKYILPILVAATLFIFPQRAYCANALKVSFVEYDEYGNLWFAEKFLEPDSHRHLFAKVDTALGALFSLGLPNTFPYPEGIQIIDIHYMHGHLTVAFSDEFGDFGGGSMLERIYLGQVLKTLLNIEAVEKVTIIANTPEGISVSGSSSWHELMDGIVR